MPKGKDLYDTQFYADQAAGSERSARAVLDTLFEFVQPTSIIDYGCGVGTWLKAASDRGVETLMGLEGPWVSKEQIICSQMILKTLDIGGRVTTPRFDLAMSLEVAEHLTPAGGDMLVENICKSADVVLFSAAAPYQGGTNHINEQWPSYWATRFAQQGFDCYDVIRPRIWTNQAIEVWYRQNALIFASPRAAFPGTPAPVMDIVHPEMYLTASREAEKSPRRVMSRTRDRVFKRR